MSRICQTSGKRPIVGNNVPKSNHKTRRRFLPNIQKKRFFIPEENRWITLKIAASEIRTIEKKGISAYLKDVRKKGVKV